MARADAPKLFVDHGPSMADLPVERFICIIEDMMLAQVDRGRLKRVLAMPLRVRGVDSGQVSVLAESGD